MLFPTPHGDKLRALLNNDKLPRDDLSRIHETLEQYTDWLEKLSNSSGDNIEQLVVNLIKLLNQYRLTIDINLVFDSPDNFLYRQKGQLKLDNTVIEEFLPRLVFAVFPDHFQDTGITVGPTTCFSAIRFESSLLAPISGGGMTLRVKDQDFAMSRNIYIQASNQPDFSDNVTVETNIAYIVAECKTNLDKTMFQEAAATALDVKQAVPGAKYYLLCEWLDMTPISTAATAIDEVIILRKQKRLSSNIRRAYNTAEGRKKNREAYVQFLSQNPFSPDTFLHFLKHIGELLNEADPGMGAVLERGYF